MLNIFFSEAAEDYSKYGKKSLLSKIFMKRHSGTNFKSSALSERQVDALVQAARWSPSSYNDQPWNFIFCDRSKTPEAYLKVLDSFYGQEWAEKAPLFVIAVVRTKFAYNGKVNEWAAYDTGAAAHAMSLLASDIGLMAHQIGGFDKEVIQQEFNLPEGYFPIAIIAIGEEDLKNKTDEKARTRYPVGQNFFHGQWGNPLD